MSLENVVIAISLVLGLILMILIIYLISRVNDLETRTFAALAQGSNQEKKPDQTAAKAVFAGLSGRELWDEWTSIANGGDDQYKIAGDRTSYTISHKNWERAWGGRDIRTTVQPTQNQDAPG
jgi:hypothetical protein